MRAPDSTSEIPLLIRGGLVVDVHTATTNRLDVTVDKGRVTGVGDQRPLSGPVDELSAEGLWLIPGLIDCHIHLVGSNVDREPFGRYLERHPETRVVRIAAHARGFLSAGVTTLRHLGHGDPKHIRQVQDAIGGGTILAPALLSCGWAVSQSGGHGDIPQWPIPLLEQIQPSAAFCDGEGPLREFVRQQRERGATWIKVFATQGTISTSDDRTNIPNFSINELTAVVEEAHNLGLRVAAHATGLEGAIRALLAGVDSLEHGPSVLDEKFLDQAQASGATVIPTLSVTAWAADEGSAHGLPDWATERSKKRLAGQEEVIAALHARGVPLALGSDSGTRPRLMGTNAEIRALVRAGFAPVEILRMATVNAAAALGMSEDLGTIGIGKRADMVALRANPLDNPQVLADPTVVAFVIQAGEVITSEALRA